MEALSIAKTGLPSLLESPLVTALLMSPLNLGHEVVEGMGSRVSTNVRFAAGFISAFCLCCCPKKLLDRS